MSLEKLKKEWLIEEKRVFKGWDFTSLKGRMIESPLPWSYRDIVINHLNDELKLLDMGTGGGEFLKTLHHPGKNTSVTEGYQPNFELCKGILEPEGISVKFVEDDGILDFDDDSFDIIINRHEHFNVGEVNRVLKPGGYFITQQVGNKNNVDFSKWFLDNPTWEYECDNIFEDVLKQLNELEFEIIKSDEIMTPLRFLDVGALVYFMKIIEWEFPNFSVEKHFDRLVEVQSIIEKEGFVESQEHRYVIVARKIK